MVDIGFWVLAVLATATAIGVFTVDSMARATYLLLASFLCVGLVLLLLDLDYLGVLVILMMTMEMAIMAIFMIMYMMNPAGLMPMRMVHNEPAALVVSIGVFLALAAGILATPWPRRRGNAPRDPTYQLGEAVMEPKMLVMMITGVALLVTMISAILLATPRGRYDRYGDDLDRTVPDDPVRGGVGQ